MDCKNYISLQNLNFSFVRDRQPFFENLAIDFRSGKINFISGKNGMGKSTLFKILSGSMQHLAQGTLSIHGQSYDIQELDKQIDFIAMVSQNFNAMLVDIYSFYQNMQFSLLPRFPSLQSLPKPKPLPQFVEKYGINFDLPVAKLSGGQRQILSILMVLQRCPKILLLDEPTATLDEENSLLVMNFLEDLCMAEDITIIAIAHDFELIKKYVEFYFELYEDHGIRKVRMMSI